MKGLNLWHRIEFHSPFVGYSPHIMVIWTSYRTSYQSGFSYLIILYDCIKFYHQIFLKCILYSIFCLSTYTYIIILFHYFRAYYLLFLNIFIFIIWIDKLTALQFLTVVHEVEITINFYLRKNIRYIII